MSNKEHELVIFLGFKQNDKFGVAYELKTRPKSTACIRNVVKASIALLDREFVKETFFMMIELDGKPVRPELVETGATIEALSVMLEGING